MTRRHNEDPTRMLIDTSIDLGRPIDRYGGYQERDEARQLLISHLTSMAFAFAHSKSIEPIKEFIRGWSFSLPPEPPKNYELDAEDDAKELITEYFMDEIIDQLIDGEEASEDMYNDYHNGDGIFHETITDRDYDLTEAAEVLSQLWRHEETDSGLWEGVNDIDRIAATKAAYTYGNAVYREWERLISEINELDIKLDVAIEIITKNENRDMYYFDDKSDEEIIDAMERYEDEFDETLRTRLRQEIEEICE